MTRRASVVCRHGSIVDRPVGRTTEPFRERLHPHQRRVSRQSCRRDAVRHCRHRNRQVPGSDEIMVSSLWFPVSGSFAAVHPNSKRTINAIEVALLEDFSLEVTCTTRHAQAKMNLIMITPQAVRANVQEAQKVLSGNGSEEDKAEMRVEADVYEPPQHALAK